MRRLVAPGLAAVVAAIAVLVPAIHAPAAAAPPERVAYRPPVDAPVADGFRAPASPYAPGNRGVDYATHPGTPVGAAAAGQVVFAGAVGTGRHVVVLHGDGMRTSYSFLASVAVARGQRVAAGQTVGESGTSLHFGARAGDAYLDPLALLAAGAGAGGVARLVPDGAGVAGTEAAERAGLRRFLAALVGGASAVGRAGGEALAWARDRTVDLAGVAAAEVQARLAAVGPLGVPLWVRLAVAVRAWWETQGTCTPAAVVPPVPRGRRRLVLVAGLGSSSSEASVDGLDHTALGYAAGDVVRFSYRGGTTTERSYGPGDTTVDLRDSGRRLRELLERLHAADPGVPIDVVAHSQGGLVARVALGARAPPAVATLVTLATPHGGADVATAVALVRRTPKGAVLAELAGRLGLGAVDLTSPAVGQLAETSGFVRDLGRLSLPEGVRVTSVAARTDAVVASPRSWLRGAGNVVVPVPGLDAHGGLPATAAARREVALALAGMAPTCQGLGDALVDVVVGEAVAAATDAAAAAAAVALAR